MKLSKLTCKIISCFLLFFLSFIKNKSFSQGTWAYHDTSLATGYTFSMDSIVFVLKSNQMWRYSPNSKLWVRKADYPGTVHSSGYNMSINGKAYFGTGFPNNEFWCYDPTNDTWSAKANFPGPARNAAFAISLNGIGYVAKGFKVTTNSGSCGLFQGSWSQTTSTNYSDFYKYDPSNNTWSTIRNSIGASCGEMTGFTANNKIYFGLGLNLFVYAGSGRCVSSYQSGGSTAISEFYEYDPALDSFTKKASLSVPGSNGDDYQIDYGRANAAGFSINNLGYVVGGYYVRKFDLNCYSSTCNYGNYNHPDNVFTYNPLKNKWSKGNKNLLSASSDKCFALGNKAYQLENTAIYQLNNADRVINIDTITGYRYCPNDSTFRIYYSRIGNFDTATKFIVEYSKDNFTSNQNIYTASVYDSLGNLIPELKNIGSQGYLNAYLYSGFYLQVPAAGCCVQQEMYYFRISAYNTTTQNEISGGTHSPYPFSLNLAPKVIFYSNTNKSQCFNVNSFSFSNGSISGSSFQWDFGDGTTASTTNSIKSYNQTGAFPVKLTGYLNGCKSTWTEMVNVFPTDSVAVSYTACDSFSYGGIVYTNSGIYYQTYTNRYGCDSVIKINLTINNKTGSNHFVTICSSQAPYLWNGLSYYHSGIYSFTTTNTKGCDSTAVLNLIVKTPMGVDSVTVCNNQIPYQWNGASYAASGVYTKIITNASGCDSTVYLYLNVSNCYVVFNVKAFLQGFYVSNSQMRPIIYNLGMTGNPTLTDTIEVALWESSSLSNMNPDFKVNSLIYNNGNATAFFPLMTLGKTFYLSLKHRNSIETWSRDPILISPENFYDFSTSPNKAYSNGINEPMANMGNGVYAIYTGDINRDGCIDISDMQTIQNDDMQLMNGYYNSDSNGDGDTDLDDIPIIESNARLFIFYARPM